MNCESLGKTVSPTKLTNIIHHERLREGLYKTHAGDIKVNESLELASPLKGEDLRAVDNFPCEEC